MKPIKYVLARKCKHHEGCDELSYMVNDDGKITFNSKKEAEEFIEDYFYSSDETGEEEFEVEESKDEIMIIPLSEV